MLLCIVTSAAMPSITDVTARQRYPWNGLVDITCNVTGIEDPTNGICFAAMAILPDSGNIFSISHFGIADSGAATINLEVHTNGNYHLVWDAKTDFPQVQYTNFVVRILLMRNDILNSRNEIQLWADGPCWAEMNVGAEAPWDYGCYFWWGDTVGYMREDEVWMARDGSSSNFLFSDDPISKQTYHKGNATLRSEGWISKGAVLAPEHDAAHVQWGGSWRMPTYDEFMMLCTECDWIWTTTNGVNGYVISGKGDYKSVSIFLPAVGDGYKDACRDYGTHGYYWSSSCTTNYVGYSSFLGFHSNYHFIQSINNRYYGYAIRPVKESVEECAVPTICFGDSTSFLLDMIVSPVIGIVTFNANGGEVDENFREVENDGIVGELPIPKRDGYLFEGWWTALEGGECVTATTIVSDDAIYYAHWGAVSEPSPADGDALYCVIDLSGGVSASSYPVSYLSEVPSGGWSDEYKTTKLVLRRMQPGSFMMLGSCNVTLTKPFYIGVFEVTQKQYELVMGESPWLADEIKSISGYEKFGIGDSHPAYFVSYDMVRGALSGAEWPASSAVDGSSFMGRIRAKTGMDGFDLPTEAQWEYACRAGTTATFGYSYGDSADGDYMWYADNSDSGSHPVGEKLPNPWGLYDMHGNVREWCLDWFDSFTPEGYGNWWDRLPAEATDPVGPSSGIWRVWRSGDYSSFGCESSDGSFDPPSYALSGSGLRLALTVTTGGSISDDDELSTFAEWANTLRGGKWLTGKIDDIAESYQARIESDGADYEARLLHAAALVASLAENSTLKSYIAMFGFEFDYLGLALSGEESDPATWPDANELVDAVVVQCVPVLQAALDDLRAIPVRWTGEVHLASTIWPLDEDVYVDIADVLCARAGIESMLGTLHFLQGYDLTVDWPKARNIDKPQIPLLEHAPSMENDDGWDGALTWSSKYDGSSAGPAIQMAFTGNALYIRLNSADGFEDDDLLECIWIGGAVGYREISVGYFVWDGNFTVNDGTVPYPEWIDGMDWSEWQELYNQYSANDIACPAEFNRSTNGITICVDVSGALSDGDIRKMALSYADILFERPSHPHYRYGWYDTNYSYAGDGKLNRIASFLEEQTNVLSSVRSLDSLAVSKEWMRGALTDALAAYAAMTNRAEDGKYRFVEYDPALSNQLDVARATTEKALASLDAVVTLDCAETFGKYNPDKDYTLLPDNGVMQVYLGALFSGGLNRDLVPTLELDKYAALKPTGIIPDPTFGGVFLSASASTWIDAFNKNNISHSLHAGSGASDVTIAESEKIDTAVQSENGSYVINAKEGVTLAKEDVIISAKIGDENADVSEGYDIAISADGKTAVATLKPPTMVDVAALPPEDGAEKDEDDGAGVLVSVPEAKIAEKPTPTAEELANGNKEVGALPVKTVRGLYYQAGWGDGLDNMRMGNKVQATGGNLYLGVIKQTGKSGFYRLNVSEK